MRSVGQILAQKRIEKGLTLSDIERATRIRLRFLKAIEHDDYSILPSRAYAEGFVKTYGKFLGLKEKDILAFFRRQAAVPKGKRIRSSGMSETLKPPIFRLTPSRFLAILLVFLVGMFLIYLVFQYRALQLPPDIRIETPQDQSITTDKRIDIIGSTDPDATVTIQGVSVLVRDDGRFYDQVTLEPGVNIIEIIATSRFGKVSTKTIEVGLEQP